MLSLNKKFEIAHETIWGVDWHPYQNIIAFVGSSKSIYLYSQNHNNQWLLSQKLVTEHTKSLRSIKFSHNGKMIAVGSFDGTITIYVFGEGQYDYLATLEGHDYEVKCVSWKQGNQKLASCSRDKNIWIWEFDKVNYDFTCCNVLEGHTQDVKYVIWIDQNTLASASYDNTIRIWAEDDDDFTPFQILTSHQSIVWCLSYCSKTNNLYSVSDDMSLIGWTRDTTTTKYSILFTMSNVHIQPIYSCCLWDADILITGGGDNEISIIDLKTRKVIKKMFIGSDINSLSVKKDKGFIGIGGDNGTLQIYNFALDQLVNDQ